MANFTDVADQIERYGALRDRTRLTVACSRAKEYQYLVRDWMSWISRRQKLRTSERKSADYDIERLIKLYERDWLNTLQWKLIRNDDILAVVMYEGYDLFVERVVG